MKAAVKPAPEKTVDAESQMTTFIGKFDEDNQAKIRAIRKALQRRLRGANELVYDNYNFFVIGYSPTERTSDSILSLAAGANAINLCFPYCGARLPDPKKILQGAGSSNRFIRLESAKTLAQPEVEAVVAAAVARCKPLATTKGKLIIRSIS